MDEREKLPILVALEKNAELTQWILGVAGFALLLATIIILSIYW